MSFDNDTTKPFGSNQPNITIPKTKTIRVYTALLNQSGTAAPVPTVLQNTLGIELTFTRLGTGQYSIQAAGNPDIFPINQTFHQIQPNDSPLAVYNTYLSSAHQITFTTYVSSTAHDDVLVNTPIEIRVYNTPADISGTLPQPQPQIKMYTAWLTQSGTSDPTTQVLQNTIGTIVWTRRSAGIYDGTLTGAFPENKTTAPPFAIKNGGVDLVGLFSSTPFDYSYTIQRNSDDAITLHCFDNTGSDAELSTAIGPSNILITINVYP